MQTAPTAAAGDMRQPGAPQLHDIVLRLCKLVPEPTAATAVKLPRAAKHLLRGAGHAVKHLLLQATPDASGVCAAVLEYLATTEHCCDRAEVTRMLDAGVVELIASSMCPETGSNAHLQSQACRLLAAMAYQLEGVAPLEADAPREVAGNAAGALQRDQCVALLAVNQPSAQKITDVGQLGGE